MKTSHLLKALAVALLSACAVVAQTSVAAKTDGSIVEQSPYQLPTYEQHVYDFHERELNTLGYILLGERRIKDSIEIFKLNVAVYPDAFNTYDSLGEAYLANNERELAIKNYRKSLKLNPQNTNATDVLKRINAQ